MKFKIKHSPIPVAIALMFMPLIFAIIFDKHNSIGSVGLLLFSLVTFLSVFTSSYEITDKSLILKYMWINKEIPFKDIRHLRYSGKPSNSQKWSLQKIEVMYGMYETYSIGVPREEEKFLQMLQEKCPQMKVMDRLEM
ncbi:PH domain-containing protein [Bacillus cereus group sp. BfR-BA-01328]|uniref:PH domain-containing protein n=1 Tax=Bacillus cereus group sp. BfR-BA-01328 TaxID=2920304 RepID=UPI001F5A57CF